MLDSRQEPRTFNSQDLNHQDMGYPEMGSFNPPAETVVVLLCIWYIQTIVIETENKRVCDCLSW